MSSNVFWIRQLLHCRADHNPVWMCVALLLGNLLLSCAPKSNLQNEMPDLVKFLPSSSASDGPIVTECLSVLRNQKVDTIIVYSRGCIGSCGFYKIFWSLRQRYYLTNFYVDSLKREVHPTTVEIQGERLFRYLGDNITTLESDSILPLSHSEMINGLLQVTMVTVDHYCSTMVEVYTNGRSFSSKDIRDFDFEKYLGEEPYVDSSRWKTNDNYLHNIRSPWNQLQNQLETVIASQPGTSSLERRMFRTIK